jgi:streptogramin lyase
MRTRHFLLAGTAAASAFLFALAAPKPAVAAAAALNGTVKSTAEGPMEGVVVSARKDGSTITVSVVTDKDGRFSFPADRLEPGHYTLKARATGYDLEGPGAVDITADKAASAALELTKTRDLSSQLNNAEWLVSMPGTDQQKNFLLNCNTCHSFERIVRSTHNSDEFLQIFKRMAGYYPGSMPTHPQRLVGDAARDVSHGAQLKTIADWLASVNLSQQDTWSYPLKVLPRLTGKSSHVIITEYDLPNKTIEPHDVVVDHSGTVWYSDFGQQYLGKLDPKSGQVTQYPIPVTKPGYPVGTLDLELDNGGNLWIGDMYQASIDKFDVSTDKFQTWSIPAAMNTDAAQFGHLAVQGTPADNEVWVKDSDGNNIMRLNLATNTFENLKSFTNPHTSRRIGSYGIHSDSQNNLYLLDFSDNDIGRIDAKTKQLTVYLTPTPGSRPRRGRVDDQDRLWFAEYGGNAIGMLDPTAGKVQEWKVPTPWSAPYDAVADKNGDAWTGSMMTDRVARLDIKTGQYTEYPLPRTTNIRRVFVDDTKNPGTLWVGSNHGASIVKVEPLD